MNLNKQEVRNICKMLMAQDQWTVDLALGYIQSFSEEDISSIEAYRFLLQFDKYYQYTNFLKFTSRYYHPLSIFLTNIRKKVIHRKVTLSHINLNKL